MSGKMKTVAIVTNENAILRRKIDAVTAERDEARDWARRMKRERDEARDLLGMMNIGKIAENLDKMHEWLEKLDTSWHDGGIEK